MALFNTGYSYPQIYSPQYQGQTPGGQTGIIWIQGEPAAKSYLVAPNTSVVLFDSESQVIYIKSADASGMPSIKILDYTIRETGHPTTAAVQTNYATKAELNDLTGQIASLKQQIEDLKKGVPEA